MQISNYYHYSFLKKLIVFTVNEHSNICIAGLIVRLATLLVAKIRKVEPTPEEVKELITSKVESVLLSLNIDGLKKKIEERRDNAIKHLSLKKTRSGNLDGRRLSTATIQRSGTIPAPEDGKRSLGPRKVETTGLQEFQPDYIGYVSSYGKRCQYELFEMLNYKGMLSDGLIPSADGFLRRNNVALKAVELCNELDSVSRPGLVGRAQARSQILIKKRPKSTKRGQTTIFLGRLRRIVIKIG